MINGTIDMGYLFDTPKFINCHGEKHGYGCHPQQQTRSTPPHQRTSRKSILYRIKRRNHTSSAVQSFE